MEAFSKLQNQVIDSYLKEQRSKQTIAESFSDLITLRGLSDVVTSKCDGCDQRLLDDDRPHWKLRDPEKYVTAYAHCRSTMCNKIPFLCGIPYRPEIKWLRRDAKVLVATPKIQNQWTEVLCLTQEEMVAKGLNSSVRLKCLK